MNQNSSNPLKKNVYELAQERLDIIFKEFDNVYISFSGGKDSGVLLNLCIDYIRKHNLKTKLGVAVKTHVEVLGTTMSLQFNADKLMSALQALTNLVSKINSTASAVNSMADNYDGLMLGFELKKVGDEQSVSKWGF